jgi:hypothetical protein
VLGTAHALNGSGLLPWGGTTRRAFETQYAALLEAHDIGSTGLTYVGSLGVSNSTQQRRRQRSLLQSSGSDGVTVYYDVPGVPTSQAGSAADELASAPTLQDFARQLRQAGLNVDSVTLVATQDGGIRLPDSDAAAPSSGGGGGTSVGAIVGGIIGGIAVGLLLLLLVVWLCHRHTKRRKAVAHSSADGGAIKGGGTPEVMYVRAVEPVGVRGAEPFNGRVPVHPLRDSHNRAPRPERQYVPLTPDASPGGTPMPVHPLREDPKALGEPEPQYVTLSPDGSPGTPVGVLPPAREPAMLPPPRHSLVQRIRDTWEARTAQQAAPAVTLGEPQTEPFDPYAPSLEEVRRQRI